MQRGHRVVIEQDRDHGSEVLFRFPHLLVPRIKVSKEVTIDPLQSLPVVSVFV